ncbi:MAG: TonB-dependent receptor plug domain-containing protein [Acidobacteria bacterium]|nr:TonB-dependent receptor plug domain-containing protein [Acidobacteriota bacterium]
MSRKLLWLPLLAVSLATGLHAQFDNAAVLGTIRDASEAVIPGASIQLTNVNTGIAQRATTDEAGNFQFLNVPIGSYQVEAENAGFKKAVSDIFTVVVGARQRVDLNLQVGDTTETVEVTGAAPIIETDSSDRSTVIGSKQAVDLPLNGRAYADLTLLAPGTSRAQVSTSGGRDASYHVNGQRSSFNNFSLDGVDNNSYGTSNQGFSNQVVQLSPDAVGEFKVVTDSFSAEYGRAGGAVINASYKSGTNQYHFTLWEFLRNTDLNATGFFKPSNGKPNLVQNQFGAAGGGAIVRNRAFFFGDYEGVRRRQSQLTFATIPNAAMRSGQMNAPIVDPYTGASYGGDGSSIPLSQQTSLARQVLADLPAPNRSGSGAYGIGSNYESLPSEKYDDNKGNIKVDYYANSKLTFFGRYSQRELNWFAPPNIPGPSGGSSNGTLYATNQAFVGGTTWTMTPTSLLEVRVGYTHSSAGKTPVNFDLPHVTDTYGIPGVTRDDRIGGGLNAQSVSGFSSWGRQTSNPQFQNPDVVNPRVNYSRILSRHTLKLGYEYQSINTDINDLAPTYGSSTYSGRFSAGGSAGDANIFNLADFFVGAQSQYQMSTFNVLKYRQRMHFGYVQDDWKASSKLTLNLGVRYEFATPQWERDNRLGNFDPTTNSLLFAKNGSLYDRALVHPDKNNWAPRIGFAYQAMKKTVIRAGYGVSYIHFNRMGGENILGFTGPFTYAITRTQTAPGVSNGSPLCGSGQDFTTCFTRTLDGYPANFLDPSQYSTSRARINYSPADNRTGYVESWHFTIQRQLGKNLALDLAYVGNRGRHQMILSDYNQPLPNQPNENVNLNARRPISGFQEIQISYDEGRTNYNAFQLKLEKKFSAGLYFINSFTWSKAIDNAPGHLETYNGDSSRINFYNVASEGGLSSYNSAANNVTGLIWDVPFGKGRQWGNDANPVVNAVLGGWRTTLINTARTGYPVHIYYSPSSQFQACGSCRQRPNYLGGDLYGDRLDPNNYFNKAALAIPTDPSHPFGNLGRNVVNSSGLWQSDIGIYKEFPLPREGARVEFRTELFNALNRTNFTAPNSDAASSSFGRITSTFPARQIQFALKLYW